MYEVIGKTVPRTQWHTHQLTVDCTNDWLNKTKANKNYIAFKTLRTDGGIFATHHMHVQFAINHVSISIVFTESLPVLNIHQNMNGHIIYFHWHWHHPPYALVHHSIQCVWKTLVFCSKVCSDFSKKKILRNILNLYVICGQISFFFGCYCLHLVQLLFWTISIKFSVLSSANDAPYAE